ncbi:uncharacterized protein TNCV_393271 [Trichonephila clavipes]|nr:uncharacterized protein TNCV_393271 [Trichonephila clavipes]
MPNIKIDDNCLFEEERSLNAFLNSNKNNWKINMLKLIKDRNNCCPSSLVVSYADCCASASVQIPEKTWILVNVFIVPSLYEGTLNNRRAANSLVRLVLGEEKWEVPDNPQGVLPQNWGGAEENRTDTCMVIKVNVNDRRKDLASCHDEFCGS